MTNPLVLTHAQLVLMDRLLNTPTLVKRFSEYRYPSTWIRCDVARLISSGLCEYAGRLHGVIGDEGSKIYRLVDPLPEWAELQLVQHQLGRSL